MGRGFWLSVTIALLAAIPVSAQSVGSPSRVFVVNTKDASVSLLDINSMKELKRLPVGPRPYGIAVSNDGKTVAVGVEDEEKVKYFDVDTWQPKGETKIGKMNNDHIILTQDGRYILVADYHSDSVIGIEMATMKEAFRISASAPHVIKYGPLKKNAYVTCKKLTGLAIVDPDTRKLVGFHQLNVNPRSLTFSPDESKAYFGSFWVNGFFEMDTKTGKVTRLFELPTPPHNSQPQEVTYHGVESVAPNMVLAANEGRSYVDAVDVGSGKLLDRLSEVSKPCCIERIPGTSPVKALVSNIGDASVALVEVTPKGKLRLVSSAAVGEAPKRVAFLPTGEKAMNTTNKVFQFEADAAGNTPAGFSVAMTSDGAAPKWIVQQEEGAPSGKLVIAQVSDDKTRGRFPLLVNDKITGKDVDLSVKFKAVAGSVDQAGGLVWRYRDKDNYYIVRANALEDNIVLYKVENGKRSSIAPKGTETGTYGQNVKVPAKTWNELRVVARGNVFEVWFDGKKLYEVEDGTFSAPGKVGLWTKADSVTLFDDLTVRIE
jgi:DNA-binding beta-propeller fold protein YncE